MVGWVGLVRIAALTLLWGSGLFWIRLSLRGWPPTHMLTIADRRFERKPWAPVSR